MLLSNNDSSLSVSSAQQQKAATSIPRTHKSIFHRNWVATMTCPMTACTQRQWPWNERTNDLIQSKMVTYASSARLRTLSILKSFKKSIVSKFVIKTTSKRSLPQLQTRFESERWNPTTTAAGLTWRYVMLREPQRPQKRWRWWIAQPAGALQVSSPHASQLKCGTEKMRNVFETPVTCVHWCYRSLEKHSLSTMSEPARSNSF